MPKSSTIGSLLLKIGAEIDRNSFETGNRLVDGVANSFNKLIGSARNAALVLGTTAVATGVVESKAYKTAEAIGVSTETLDLWKASAKIAGLGADSLVASMSKVADVMANEKWDTGKLLAFEKELDKLRMSYSEIRDLSPDKAVEKIIDRAQELLASGASMSEMYAILNSVLGSGAADLLTELNRRKMTMSDFLAGASKTVFTDSTSNQNAQNFNVQVQTLKQEFQSMGALLGGEVGGVLEPHLKAINEWIQENGEEIKDAIKNIAEFVGRIANKVAPIVGATVKTATALLGGDLEEVGEAGDELGYAIASAVVGADKVAEGQRKQELIKMVTKAQMEKNGNLVKRINFADLDPSLQAEINAFRAEYPKNAEFGQIKGLPKIKDGIIKPDGTITQVSSEDWVFAARNLGDLARAFIPHNYSSVSGGEYVINQTFNINGSKDMPQILRQQAFRGTQEGLMQAMSQSTQRLQLMSGTR